MNKRRLLKLADLLEADAKNKKGIKFDLSPILQKSNGGVYVGNERPTYDCGTTGCAIGLWALSGKFRGVKMVNMYEEYWPSYRDEHGLSAAELYFDLTETESGWLFTTEHYTGPTKGKEGERAVAKRIRAFVAGKAAPPIVYPA